MGTFHILHHPAARWPFVLAGLLTLVVAVAVAL
jgi:hypothetical protein